MNDVFAILIYECIYAQPHTRSDQITGGFALAETELLQLHLLQMTLVYFVAAFFIVACEFEPVQLGSQFR